MRFSLIISAQSATGGWSPRPKVDRGEEQHGAGEAHTCVRDKWSCDVWQDLANEDRPGLLTTCDRCLHVVTHRDVKRGSPDNARDPAHMNGRDPENKRDPAMAGASCQDEQEEDGWKREQYIHRPHRGRGSTIDLLYPAIRPIAIPTT